jgi:hypothetical protein
MEVNIYHIYISYILDFEGEGSQYGICIQAAFKNARAMLFSTSGGAGSSFQVQNFPGKVAPARI